MKLNKRTTTIILWAVSIGLLAGMVISFTPGGLGFLGASNAARGPVEMTVNGQNIYQFDVQQARANALFSAVTEGEVGADLQRLMVDQIARQAVLDQAASRISVSDREVRQAVSAFREERGVAGGRNDRAYQDLIGALGFTDQAFRAYWRDQLRLQKFQDSLVGDVEVTDEEVATYYEANQSAYQTEERILARQIVVNDEELAQRLRARAIAGESFAALARENSLDLADRDGAIGAASGETEPRPVGAPALPTLVANQAFMLRGAGITDVVESNQRYYIVAVEEYLPAQTQPFEEVEESVREDALNAKISGIFERELDRLRDEATLTFPADSELSFVDPVVAEVNGVEITAVDVDYALYSNPQIQQSLSPQVADLIVGLFRPSVQSQVIDMEVAYQAADDLGVPFVGTRAGVAQAVYGYVTRDVTATEEEFRDYYDTNLAMFTLPPEAFLTRVDFTDQGAATAFRLALLGGASLEDALATTGGEAADLGLVKPGQLELEIDTALFSTQAFEALPDGALDVSDVLVLRVPVPEEELPAADDAAATDENAEAPEGEESADADGSSEEEPLAEPEEAFREQFVVLVAERTPERVRSYEDVRGQVEATVLAEKRQAARLEWVEEQRAAADIVEYSVADAQLPTDMFTFEPDAAADEAGDQAGDLAGDATGEADAAGAEAGDQAGDDASETDEAGSAEEE